MTDRASEKPTISPGWRSRLPVYIPVFLILFVLSLFTPMVSDDFGYSYSFVDWTRIRHIGEIIPSMAVHRQVQNGRVFVHGIVQLLLMLPRVVFALLNALNAVLLLAAVRRLAQAGSRLSETLILVFAFFYLCCFTPAFGENFLWLVGSVNYAWGLSVSLLFLLPFLTEYTRPDEVKTGRLRFLAELVLAFLAGTWSESASLILLFLAFCLLLLHCLEARSFSAKPLLRLVFAGFGYLFLMTAPATAGRAGSMDISVIGYNFRMIFRTAQSELLIPLLLYAVLLALALSFHMDRKTLWASLLLLCGALLSLLSYVFATYFVLRHLCFAVFFLMLASALLLSGLCRTGRNVFLSVATACLTVLFLLEFPVGVLDVAVSYHKQQLRVQQIREAAAAGEHSVTLENYYPYTKYAIPFIMNATRPDYAPNVNMEDYYGIAEIYGVDPPEEAK